MITLVDNRMKFPLPKRRVRLLYGLIHFLGNLIGQRLSSGLPSFYWPQSLVNRGGLPFLRIRCPLEALRREWIFPLEKSQRTYRDSIDSTNAPPSLLKLGGTPPEARSALSRDLPRFLWSLGEILFSPPNSCQQIGGTFSSLMRRECACGRDQRSTSEIYPPTPPSVFFFSLF